MTHTSQLSHDYFSHKPRSFVSPSANFTEKEENFSNYPPRGRRDRHELVAYTLPSPNTTTATATATATDTNAAGLQPRVPRSRTLLRLALLLLLVGFGCLGARCEVLGCRGRGGGGIVEGYVGGGGVVGVDLEGALERSGWGGEGVVRDEEGEIVGEIVGLLDAGGGEGRVEWDDEEGVFGAGEGLGDALELEVQGDSAGQEGRVEYELYEAPLGGNDGLVGELTGPIEDAVEPVFEAGAQTDAVSDAASDAQPITQDDDAASDSASAVHKSSWLGSMDGLW